MQFTILTTDALSAKTACLVVTVADGKITGTAKAADKALGGLISALKTSGDLPNKPGEALLLPTNLTSKNSNVPAQRILLVGVSKDALDDQGFIKLTSDLAGQLIKLKVKDAVLCLEDVAVKGRDLAWKAQQAARLHVEASYQFNKFKSDKAPKPALKKVALPVAAGKGQAAIRKALAFGKAVAIGVNEARELGDLPGNICNPAFLASRGRALARTRSGITCKVLDEKQMKELGMGALLSVSAGSDNPGKMVILEYKGGKKTDQPVVLVGKGVTFDSGGISLKPGAAMDEMKYDMGGAATVFGVLNSVAEMKLPINVVGIVGTVENMPSGKATRPGDIVTSMSGQTIEILNTDAEGRLVLCDALTYAGRYKPQVVIDIATLTGACIIALGHHATGVYSNDDKLANSLLSAGVDAGDRGWHMPLWDDYNQQLKSNFADIPNITGGRDAGSVTAACFLSRFTKDYTWAHLDIAGTFWNSGANKGATGRPVPLLVEYLKTLTK